MRRETTLPPRWSVGFPAAPAPPRKTATNADPLPAEREEELDEEALLEGTALPLEEEPEEEDVLLPELGDDDDVLTPELEPAVWKYPP